MKSFIGTFKSYPIYISDKYPKKYYSVINGKRVYFGDIRYQQYYDKIGYYKILDHVDDKRRKSFWSRHNKSINKIASPGWFSLHILW